MKAIGYAGRRFADLNVGANFPSHMQQGPPKSAVVADRAGASPLPVTTRQGVRTITIEFVVKASYDTEETLMTLLGALDPGSPEPRVFVAEITGTGAHTGQQIEALATVGQYRYGAVNNVFVDFHMADDLWYERMETTVLKQSFAASVAIPLYNQGGATVAPIVKLGYDTQRTTEAPTVGWKYRRTIDVTNNGTTNWNEVRLTLDLGDTAAWVTATKAQSDGDDVRVWFEGRDLPRTLTNFNSERTWCHIVASIPAGETATFEVVYGNPDATSPETLSVRTSNAEEYAADDLGGDFGTATAGSTTTFTDSGATWETDEWANGYMLITSGTQAGRARRIASNTGTVITFNRALSSSVAVNDKYVLWKSGLVIDGGRVTGGVTATAFQDNLHTTKFPVDALTDATITFLSGSASPATMTVASNTADTITLTSSFSVNPAVGDTYAIYRDGLLSWNVNRSVYERDHRGLWRNNRYHSKGARTWYGDQTPAGWTPWLMLDNQDDFAQGRYVDQGSGGGHSINNWPYLYARRSVRSDNTWPEKGIADGVCFFDPRGLIAFDWLYQMKNENGLGMVVVMSQETGGEDWQTQASDSTTRASLVDVTSSGATGLISLSGTTLPVRLYTGVLPADGVEVPSTEKKSRSIELRSHSKCIMWLSLENVGGHTNSLLTIGSEAAMYDLQAVVRIGGGTSSTPPYDKITCGPRFGLASGQRLWINPSLEAGTPLLGLYSSSDVLVSRVPWAATIARHEYNVDGTNTATVARELLPVAVGNNLIQTGEDDTTGWDIANSAGVTASISNETSTKYDGGTNSLKVTVTTTPAGAWTITLTRTAGAMTVIPGTLYEFGMAYRRNSLTNAITCQMSIAWKRSGTTSTTDGTQTIGSAMATADQWYTDGAGKKIHAGSAAEAATDQAVVSIVIAGTGSTSGSIYLDEIALGIVNAYISESEIGTISAEFAWTEAYRG